MQIDQVSALTSRGSHNFCVDLLCRDLQMNKKLNSLTFAFDGRVLDKLDSNCARDKKKM